MTDEPIKLVGASMRVWRQGEEQHDEAVMWCPTASAVFPFGDDHCDGVHVQLYALASELEGAS